MSHDDFAAANIARFGNHAGESGNGKSRGSTYGPGEGPGGSQVYGADWYEEPSPGLLAPYLPSGGIPPGAWATIQCQTLPHYRVENCMALSESPPGSGLKTALRRAAAGFLVRPPTIDGKPMIGVWVRIRFNWIERGDK